MNDLHEVNERARKAAKAFIESREVFAVLSITDNAEYEQICEQQKEREQAASEVLRKLEKEEREIINRYIEGENEKAGRESDVIYLQGVKDCMSALVFFGGFGAVCGSKKPEFK